MSKKETTTTQAAEQAAQKTLAEKHPEAETEDVTTAECREARRAVFALIRSKMWLFSFNSKIDHLGPHVFIQVWRNSEEMILEYPIPRCKDKTGFWKFMLNFLEDIASVVQP